jgi:cell division protein FtsL
MSDFYFLFSIIVLVLSIILIVAQLKLFSIDKTLKSILAQVQSDRRASEYNMKMLLFEIRGDSKSAAQLEADRKASSDAAR